MRCTCTFQTQIWSLLHFEDSIYFSGKCSHGGILDSSRKMGAKGGINKDSTSPLFSPHHYLHVEAATVATEATLTVLRDLRDTVGHKTFLK